MEHPLQQLVQRAKTLDNEVGSEMALAPVNSAATQPDEVDS
jgi:hypothetical protein